MGAKLHLDMFGTAFTGYHTGQATQDKILLHCEELPDLFKATPKPGNSLCPHVTVIMILYTEGPKTRPL